MTIDLPSTMIAGGIGVCVWFLVRMTVFDAIRELRASNERQGVRLGKLEAWTEAHDKVDADRSMRVRVRTAAGGVPISDEDP